MRARARPFSHFPPAKNAECPARLPSTSARGRDREKNSKFIIIYLHLKFLFSAFFLQRDIPIRKFDEWKSRRSPLAARRSSVVASRQLSNTQCINYARLIMDAKWQNKRRSNVPHQMVFVLSNQKRRRRGLRAEWKNWNKKKPTRIGFHIIWIIFV